MDLSQERREGLACYFKVTAINVVGCVCIDTYAVSYSYTSYTAGQ